MQLALYQPDIPQNFGSIVRLAACMGAICHVIEPCGFVFDDKRLRRVAMDYIDDVQLVRHASWEAFLAGPAAQARLVLLSTKATMSLYNAVFQQDDILLLGRESAGVPEEVAARADLALRIPLMPAMRSLNVGHAAAMALGEVKRQIAAHNPL